jgi:site-specific recombinase XerC
MLGYLRGLGVVPPGDRAGAGTPVELAIDAYEHWLVAERALSAASIRSYLRVARRFLRSLAAGEDLALGTMEAATVTQFVLAECSGRSVAWSKMTVTGLRSFLRYLYLDGQLSRPLAAAVPTAASWQLATLPRSITEDQMSLLVTNCDRRSALGRRDAAILTVLLRLGLRAGEVAAARLADIDWRRGEMVVRGKGSRREVLPLPADVGQAIAEWLRWGRPGDAGGGAVFTRLRAPHDRLASSGVSAIVRRACHRAGVPVVGAHRLRHTTATQILAHGGSLEEIGQVLRHARLATTALYAKVDMPALALVAHPWPGGQS